MIRKLRSKFTAAAMLSLFLVLTVLMGAVNLYNYHRVSAEADQTLAVLSQNRGRCPQWMTGGWDRPGDAGWEGDRPENGEGGWYAPGMVPPSEDRIRNRQGLSPELPFESRFFSVVTGEDGSAAELDLDNIAAVDEAEAASLAERAAASGKSSGYIGQYRFCVSEQDGGVRITFLDCTRSLSNARSFLTASVVVSLIGLAAVFLLTLWLSGRFTRPVAESYEKQRQFITDAGHELKTPLTIIDADAELLAMELPDSEWIGDIRSQTRRLASLTNDLVFLSKMDEDRLELQRLEFPISDMVGETVQTFRSRAIRENKELSARIEPMLSSCGDERSLRQLVNILLDNALKYSPEGGTVDVELKKAVRGVSLAVTNTCDAVPEGDLDRLFDRFYRAERSRSSATGGHGLGLSIARAVVTAHKGRITASSPAENTIRFDVFLPV